MLSKAEREISRERDLVAIHEEMLESESLLIVEENIDKLSLCSSSDWTVACDITKAMEHQEQGETIRAKEAFRYKT